MWLTDLAKLADPKYGLTVVFEPGWRTRGASGGDDMRYVAGALWHHDVSPRRGTYPLRHMLRDGRPGLTGPLCHIGFDRDGVVHVVGAGKANHAGTGKVPGVLRNGGNRRLVGVEMTSAGTRPWDWTGAQLREMPKLGAALGDIFGYGPDENWAHYEYSDSGKIDPAGLPGAMPGLRSRIAEVRFPGYVPGPGMSVPRPTDPSRPWRTSARVAGMSDAEVREIQETLLDLDLDLGHWGADGSYGDATGAAVKALQQDLGVTADGIYGPSTQEALMSKLDDILFHVKYLDTKSSHIPGHLLDEPIALAGMHEGQTSSARTKLAWQGHNFTQTHQLLAAVLTQLAAQQKTIEALAAGQGIGPEVLEQVREAAAEGARQGGMEISAEDVAALLQVTVQEG